MTTEELAALLGGLLALSEILSRTKRIKPNGIVDFMELVGRALLTETTQEVKKGRGTRRWF